MKDKYFCKQALLITNQLAIIIYLILLTKNNVELPHNTVLQLVIITLWVFHASYISYTNIRNNITLDKFILLIIIVVWCFSLSLSAHIYLLFEISKILLPLILYQTLSFVLTFLFQGNTYKYKNSIYFVMTIFCVVTVLFKFVSETIFNFSLLIQLALTTFIMIFVLITHKKRMIFILKNQKMEILISAILIVVPSFLYYLYFQKNSKLLDNIGGYIIYSICFTIIHSIIFDKKQKNNKHLSLESSYKTILMGFIILSIVLFKIIFEMPIIAMLVLINTTYTIIQIYNILLYLQMCKISKSDEYKYQNFYSYSLSSIKNEETLKKEMSEFLHDNVLQDLLSLKMLLNKSENPNIKKFIADILDKLNHKVRSQMEQYHPVILKRFTLKKNYENLIKTINQMFPLSNSEIIFTCHDDIFLADPYNVIIYRIMRELITNSIKHSAAKVIQVNLSLERDIITLEVLDNGIGFNTENNKQRLEKGLMSVCDSIYSLEGNISLNSNIGQGTNITITIPMKGENSYENFISR